MKRNFALISLFLMMSMTIAAQKLSWQAVVRDNDNKLVSNRSVTVEASVLDASDATVFKERHDATTNVNGMLSLTIGNGALVSGSLDAVNWDGAKIKTVITWPGGGSGVTNITPVNAVPYALYAASAGNSVAQVNADWNAANGVAAILNKPHVYTADELQDLFAQYLSDNNYVNGNNCQNTNYCDLLQRIADLEDEIQQLKNQGGNNNDTSSTAPKPCPGAPTAVDYDGNVYQTVQIGSQCWLKTNLRTTHFSDGTEIAMRDENNYNDDRISIYFDDPQSDPITYGFYYNANAALNGRGICPEGWHVPIDEEWTVLANNVKNNTDYLCSQNLNNISKALAAKTGWEESTEQCTPGNNPADNDMTGFSAIAAGNVMGGTQPYNYDKGYYANFWSCTRVLDSLSYVRTRVIISDQKSVQRRKYHERSMISIRCVRGEGGTEGNNGGNGNNLIDTTETESSCPGMPTVSDNEGNMYQTVKIGAQCWMKSNLRTKHYNDGTEISSDMNQDSYYYDNKEADPLTFGLYYSGHVVNDDKGICPQGWHVPTVDEYKALVAFVKSQPEYFCSLNSNMTAPSLAEKRFWNWSDLSCTPGFSVNDNNTTGFSAIPAGYYSPDQMSLVYYRSMFWTSVDSLNTPYYKHIVQIMSDSQEVQFNRQFKRAALSVRCLRDAEIPGGNNPNDGYSSLTDTASCANIPTVTDIDGNVYKTVKIGNQCWLRSNLRTTRLSDGSEIQNGRQNQCEQSAEQPYFYKSTSCDRFSDAIVKRGLFYNNAAANSAGICPQGWKVPSSDDMQALIDFVSSQEEYRCDATNQNSVAKSLAVNVDNERCFSWDWDNFIDECSIGYQDGEFNRTNFSSYPTGYLNPAYCYIEDDNRSTRFWATGVDGKALFLQYNSAVPVIETFTTNQGFPIRCIKE